MGGQYPVSSDATLVAAGRAGTGFVRPCLSGNMKIWGVEKFVYPSVERGGTCMEGLWVVGDNGLRSSRLVVDGDDLGCLAYLHFQKLDS